MSLLAALLAGCGQNEAAGGPGGMPPTQVGVIVATPGPVGLASELPGRLEPVRVAQVRARAAGILQRRVFKEGSDVKAGQTLFEIDSAPYRATLASAQASLARSQANLVQAKAQAERNKPLVAAKAISQQDYLNSVAAYEAAEADVAAGKAAVDTARINLGYAAVTAPISGRIGRALVTEGALVGQGEATQLAVVQQINPMYVNFTQSTTDVMNLRRQMAAGKLKKVVGENAASVRVVLEDGSEYERAGKLLFSDLTVDPTSGQITLRAEVPNPDGILLPGMYVRVRLEQAQLASAILVPQQAVTRGPQGDTLMVVGGDGKVEPRQIKIGGSQGNSWIVLEGLKAGEQVMVDGFQKLHPGAPVKAVPWVASAASGASGPTGGNGGSPAPQ
ncbi:MAG TPA: efflux RND transporter periplasmic adaptor subunit [Burkholderiaceae bacterium]|jgi:membrane fusion protein (multidrug efflux system)|nr:efflux RND transporter periplasmic adaptor subunit [Burkholderiaceae bacterium]